LPGGIKTFVGTGRDPQDLISPSFLSAVTVYGKWSMGLSLQDVVNIDDTAISTFAFTTAAPETFSAVQGGSIGIDVINLNVSAGVRVNDRLGIGGTLTLSRLGFRSDVSSYVVDTSGSIIGEPVVEPTLDLRTVVDDTDDDVVYSLGVLYKQTKWQLGAAYRRGPDFTVTEQIVSTQDGNGDGQPDGLDFRGVADRLGSRFGNRFHLPDVLGVGASWFPNDRTTLALEIERVTHSNLADGFVSGINVLTDEDWVFGIDDGTDVRLGFERIFFNFDNWMPPTALRLGTFSETPNTIEARSTGSAVVAPPQLFGDAGRQQHFSIGAFFGLGRWKLDVAADFAETKNEYVVSLIYQGKKKRK